MFSNIICSSLIFLLLSLLFWYSSFSNFKQLEQANEDWFSSVWCRGSSAQSRLCHFQNLCFNPQVNEFIFFHGPRSIVSGHPTFHKRLKSTDKEDPNPSLTTLTSVFNMNSFSFDYTTLPLAAKQNLTIINTKGTSYFYSRFKSDNLMHVIHDDLLPIYATLQELSHHSDIRLAFFDNAHLQHEQKFSFLYEKLTPGRAIVYSWDLNPNLTYCFEAAYVGVNTDTVWYDYGFLQPQKSLLGHKIISKPIINDFKRQIFDADDVICDDDNKYVVLLLRKRTRLILNSEEVQEIIKKVTGWKVKILIEDEIREENFNELLLIVRCAAMFVGMHSAALILALFLPPQALLIEMFPYAIEPSNYTPYKTLAEINNLRYSSWVNDVEANTVSHPERSPELGGIRHLTPRHRRQIEAATTVAPHLCCQDPSWLFRIYQDTWVDATSFFTCLQKALAATFTSPHDDDDDLPEGPVRNLHCASAVQQEFFNLSWDPPWNLQFLKKKERGYQYEIWVEEKLSKEMKAIITTNNYILLNKTSDEYNCWVHVHQSNTKMAWSSCPPQNL